MCRVEASGRQNSQGDIVPSPPNANLQQVEHEEAEQQQRELPGAQPDVRAEHHRRHSEAQHQLAHAMQPVGARARRTSAAVWAREKQRTKPVHRAFVGLCGWDNLILSICEGPMHRGIV